MSDNRTYNLAQKQSGYNSKQSKRTETIKIATSRQKIVYFRLDFRIMKKLKNLT